MQASSLTVAAPASLSLDERKQEYRDAMARLGAAVNIVTTDGPGGLAGFAATAVCSVTDSPPTLLVCLNRGSSAYPAVNANRVLCVNTLERSHEELSRLFGGKTPVNERFEGASWSSLETGAPVLDDALISLDCRVKAISDGGTHDILICDVVAIRENDGGQALIYFDRRYHAI
ncbi:pyrimidine utilization flavin reductase protein F [Agrobacterium sp. SHOUNA12C]|uniref:FMN reductase (NADH) RutF n=1 Tax=Rhizobium rhizogenes NBRC 13257 TaxID=1220581 RepID=A0AA87QA25_RHIRH|nr:pyrimidine utilization flavin reductase protein F [Rhizobium rhizogenes]MCJ9721321.1 pyrimidine utilization flavin reductase protein F [Agrobacterium sp. BETTINA12B]MCJ9757459.1 pyrimidine utilization flavin reductase protein F [Agrobacterium sp. SHOUNA12C]NTF57199.1 pyrimidine utilization flavin reductase protein F [Rhizobium rhizogenes]NTF76781.1 pyrimidine utilization flavin reductase protein F [Rhizobium rhizogenes]NTF95498.1 pyrimidine utilization flavin reductase protein F [Rhizobium 